MDGLSIAGQAAEPVADPPMPRPLEIGARIEMDGLTGTVAASRMARRADGWDQWLVVLDNEGNPWFVQAEVSPPDGVAPETFTASAPMAMAALEALARAVMVGREPKMPVNGLLKMIACGLVGWAESAREHERRAATAEEELKRITHPERLAVCGAITTNTTRSTR